MSSEYKASAKALVRQRLRDPASAEFTDVRVIPGRPGGTVVCGRVNARTGFGGMAGPHRFIVGRSVMLEDEIGAALMNDLWATSC